MTIRAHWLMLMAACLAFAPHVAAHAQGGNAAQVQADDDDDDDDRRYRKRKRESFLSDLFDF